MSSDWGSRRQTIQIPVGGLSLDGDLTLPEHPTGLVVFAHGSGSSRQSPRNRYVAEFFNDADMGTLLFDLLTQEENAIDEATAELRFNIPFLSERLVAVMDWIRADRRLGISNLHIGLFGASTGAAAALKAAAARPEPVYAVVSRGGRPDLAEEALQKVQAPTLLIVGGEDDVVIDLNRKAAGQLIQCDHRLDIIPDATHLFPEPGKLEEVAQRSCSWFEYYFTSFPMHGSLTPRSDLSRWPPPPFGSGS